MELTTPHGPALVEVDGVPDPRFLLVLTHGSAGGVDAPDLLAVRDAVLKIGGVVARVTQPFRLRGARAPGSAVKQDEAWTAAVEEIRRGHPGLPLAQGGRSNGARVACRTARAVGAEAVVALAFPLHPPRKPERSRAPELRAAGTEVLVVNGDRDPFGVPEAADAARLVVLAGEGHDLNRDPARVGEVVADWLGERMRRKGTRPGPA
ncbi:alpha/beta hydrolase [Planobispora rosea]|uniref:Alpha/beta hydrolase n=1 Tax=Planobispora rosea TaxID=35762 RepID=A0A8J3WEE8_PLARO|nr:alpha/beta family hydrolase [Planobispora rosea]GGS76835.1 alpha/beta hydrolase [Planobispora rosea]GIH86163.1 alpha/beta hydrolase [Planobispora rosea]